MKTPSGAILAIFLVSLMLSGCGRKPDPLAERIGQLELKVAALQIENDSMRKELKKSVDSLTAGLQENKDSLVRVASAIQKEFDPVLKAFESLQTLLKDK